MRIVWSRRSLRHLEGIYDYIREHDPTAARRVHRVIRGTVEQIAELPRKGRPGRIDDTRELVVSGLPYIVAYRIKGEVLEVAAVLHAARAWPESFGK